MSGALVMVLVLVIGLPVAFTAGAVLAMIVGSHCGVMARIVTVGSEPVELDR
jgi:hypothetical protein